MSSQFKSLKDEWDGWLVWQVESRWGIPTIFGFAWNHGLIPKNAQITLVAFGAELLLLIPLVLISKNNPSVFIFFDMVLAFLTLIYFEVVIWRHSKLVFIEVLFPCLFILYIAAVYLQLL